MEKGMKYYYDYITMGDELEKDAYINLTAKTIWFLMMMIIPTVLILFQVHVNIDLYFLSGFGILFWLVYVNLTRIICKKMFKKYLYVYYYILEKDDKQYVIKRLFKTFIAIMILYFAAEVGGYWGNEWLYYVILFIRIITPIILSYVLQNKMEDMIEHVQRRYLGRQVFNKEEEDTN